MPQPEDDTLSASTSDNENSSDQDDSQIEDVVEEPEATEEEPYTPLTVQDLPGLLDSLEAESTDPEIQSKAYLAMTDLIYKQGPFLVENLSANILPRLIPAAQSASNDDHRRELVTFIASIANISPEAQQAIVPYIPEIISILSKGDMLDRYYILALLEQVADAEPSSHELIKQGARALYASYQTKGEPVDETHLATVIAVLENVVLNSLTTCLPLFLEAHAFTAVLYGVQSTTKARIAAVSCLTQLINQADVLDAHLSQPEGQAKGSARRIIVQSMFQLMNDPVYDGIAKEAIQFIAEERDDADLDAIVLSLVQADPSSLVPLVFLLGKKELNTVGAPAEFALMHFLEKEETKPMVVEAFRKVWEAPEGEVAVQVKFNIVQGLIDSFLQLRKQAMEGGMLDFFFSSFKDDKYAFDALTLFNKLMDTEQTVGYRLLNTPGTLSALLDIFDGPRASLRPLAASILIQTIQSYDDESTEQRAIAVKSLTDDPATLARILLPLQKPSRNDEDEEDKASLNASANLLAELLAGEMGTESWGYDPAEDKPPPPSPLKDALLTPALALRAVDLLRGPATSPSALNLLCQFCWGHARGLEMVAEAFGHSVPGGDVWLFKGLYAPYVTRYVSRQRARVASAAVNAGALERVGVLLNEDYTNKSKEERCAAMAAYRTLLAADDVDLSIGRHNLRVPLLLSQILRDRDEESLRHACWMLRLLSDSDDPAWCASWADTPLASQESAREWAWWLERPSRVDEVEKPVWDEETMGEETEEFRRKERRYEAEVKTIREDENELRSLVAEGITNLIPLLAPFASLFIGPLLDLTNQWDQDRTLMRLLDVLASTPVSQPSLLPAIRALLSSPTPPALSTCYSWISQGPALALAFFDAGVLNRAQKAYEPDEEGNVAWETDSLQIYEYLVKTIEGEAAKAAVKRAFFGFGPVLDHALGRIMDKDDFWTGQQAVGVLAAMTEGAYEEGLEVLRGKEGLFGRLLDMLVSDNGSASDDFASVIGRMCRTGEEAERLEGVMRGLVRQLTPPEDGDLDALSEGKKGKKKKKKNKGYQPKISLGQVLLRFQHFVPTSSAARHALFSAGALDVAKDALATSPHEDNRRMALSILTGFVTHSLEPAHITAAAGVLPLAVQKLKADFEPLLALIEFAQAFVSPSLAHHLVESGMHTALWVALTDFPSASGDMAVLIYTVRDLGETEVGRPALAEAMRESLLSEGAFEQEGNWGNAHALRRLVVEGSGSASLVVGAGAMGYAERLMRSGDLHYVAIGAALAATLARSEFLPEIRAELLDLGVPALIEQGHAQCVEEAKKPFTSEAEGDEREAEESAHRELVARRKQWAESLADSLKIVNGEEVDNFEENFWL